MGNVKIMATFKIKEILSEFNSCTFIGDENTIIITVKSINDCLDKSEMNSLSWISDKNIDTSLNSKLNLGLLILSRVAYEKLKGNSCNFLICENPRSSFVKILESKFSIKRVSKIERSAAIDDTALIGENCYIGNNVVIERNCTIGKNTTILHNTVILEDTKIGNNVFIGCNNTIGNYGFGYEKDDFGNYKLLQHLGNVVIEDNVEIHNNTCIDKGVLGSTLIKENVKIDNLVHVAHNVIIGRNCLIIANAMLGGSIQIDENNWIAPSTSIKNKVVIGKNNVLGMGAVLLKNINDNQTLVGNPAVTLSEYQTWSKKKKDLLK